ncbi:MAG TPA: DUF998 domain-containing protein, partial [Streptomyces sp.]
MRLVPWWTLLSSGCAPVVLIGGSTTAAVIHGPGYSPVRQTISVLASDGPSGYWWLTATLIVLGSCHLATACGLRAAGLAGRVALGAGGVSAMVLALFPAPSSGGSMSHGSVVAVGFSLLALWPVLAADRRGGAPWGLRPAPSLTVSALMIAGGAWFLFELQTDGPAGVAERILTAAQSLWPVVVVVSCLL